jgi:NADH:ubiquinone oxidoreductase subunit C
MTRIETSLERLLDDIGGFYKPMTHHFLTVNGIDLGGGKIELQWIFSPYGVKDDITLFFTIISYDAAVPSVRELIPSAYLSEMEIVDLFGLAVEGAAKGLYLDPDSLATPLRSKP